MNKKISIFVALIFTISIASLAIYEEFFAFESRGFSTNDEKKLLSGFKSFSDFVETGGFESADEARDMLAKGFLAFDEFVKTGGFESVDEARDLMSKGFLAFDEFVKTGGFESEPHRVCRRLQLMSRMEHHEQDNKQIFPRSARTSCSHGFGQSRAA